jgi:flagellin
LQSQISGLKQASVNVAQGNSLLQVAQGGLGQIREILDLMNSTAVQANSASLTTTDRIFLQEQFAQYLSEVDRIANNTSFNAITLLNGALSGAAKALTQTTPATKASGTLTFGSNPTAGQTVALNGVSLIANTNFTVGGSTQLTLDSLVLAINNSTNTALSNVVAERTATNVITLTARSGGKLGNQFIINQADSTASFTTSGAATNVTNVFTLSGGADNGLGFSSTRAVGTTSDSLVTAQSQIAASATLTLNGTVSDGELFRIDNGNGGLIDFTFRNTASSATEIQIGATTEETLQNIVAKLSQYNGSDNFGLRQLEFAISGTTLTISSKTPGNPTDLNGAALDIAETLANGTLSTTTLNNGVSTGINVSAINNGDFIGTIQGFSATYNSSDNITVNLTVGSSVYTATLADTTPASDTTLRFSSANGGFFDVRLASGGLAVTNQTSADTYASRLNTAFSTLSFYNNRPVSNFQQTGTFIEASARLQLKDFSDVRIDSISVVAPATTDGRISIVVNGETFSAESGLGGRIGAYETVTFTSALDSNKQLILNNGSIAKDLSNATAASSFQSALRSAFGLGPNGNGVNFQIGTDGDDVVNVVINDVRSNTLFNGVAPSVASQSSAAAAQAAIAIARNAVLSAESALGAQQQRFDFAQRNITNTIEGVTQARSNLADTDIAAESINYAQLSVKINAAVAVIAQARNLQSSLLGALQFGGARA